jgi:hypothetical protein
MGCSCELVLKSSSNGVQTSVMESFCWSRDNAFISVWCFPHSSVPVPSCWGCRSSGHRNCPCLQRLLGFRSCLGQHCWEMILSMSVHPGETSNLMVCAGWTCGKGCFLPQNHHAWGSLRKASSLWLCAVEWWQLKLSFTHSFNKIYFVTLHFQMIQAFNLFPTQIKVWFPDDSSYNVSWDKPSDLFSHSNLHLFHVIDLQIYKTQVGGSMFSHQIALMWGSRGRHWILFPWQPLHCSRGKQDSNWSLC